MISPAHAQAMARYNRWQNRSIYGAADTLTDDQRRESRGAFFGSIHGTLNHILWADEVWMGRLAGRAHPATPIARSHERYLEWEALSAARDALDVDIITWAGALEPAWLTQSPAAASGGRTPKSSRSRGFLVVHMFNHQTHHRGQVHALLTAAGARTGDTDLLKL